jgi:hypothetical protein
MELMADAKDEDHQRELGGTDTDRPYTKPCAGEEHVEDA